MRPWPSSLRVRLTLWHTAFLAIPLMGFAAICYFIFAGALQLRTDRFIGDAVTAFSRELAAERRANKTVDQAIRSTVDEVRFRDLLIAVLDSAGHVEAASELEEGKAAAQSRAGPDARARIITAARTHGLSEPITVDVATEREDFRVISRPMLLGDRRIAVVAAYPLRDMRDVLTRIRHLFLIAIPLLLLSAATGGYLLAKRSLAPVAAMAARAAAISVSTLHDRLPVGGGDELVGLARVVNDLLDRLERSFEQQRRFMADASHELRTPTAIVRTEADVTLSRGRDADDYRASMIVIQEAARRLTRIVDDLFLLARFDSTGAPARREAIYLEEVVHSAARAVRQVAEQLGVRVALGDVIEAPFHGDPDLLGRLLLNLLDNAIKHSPQGGTVDIRMARRADRIEVAVIDGGPGIPPEAHAHIFERFFRADDARSRTEAAATSGAGLGLAIARRIAELHSGQLELIESRPGRTELRLSLPATPAPPESVAERLEYHNAPAAD